MMKANCGNSSIVNLRASDLACLSEIGEKFKITRAFSNEPECRAG